MRVAVLGGLIDSVNPCAFAVIIFLFSFLSTKREMVLPAIWFITGVFITYFSLGIGGYFLLEKIVSPEIANITTRVIAGAVVILGLAHIFGKSPSQSKLSLSKDTRNKIHSLIIRTGLSKRAKFSFFGLGIVVSLLESACTGQVYLPVIYSFIALGEKKAILSLLMYNICFVLPLIVACFVVSQGKKFCVGWDEKYMKKFKIVMGVFLVLLGFYLLQRGCVNCG